MIVQCSQCGIEFDKPDWYIKRNMKNHFCSSQCNATFHSGEDSPRWNSIESVCPNCGDKFIIKKSQNERCKVSCCSKECMYEYRRNNGHMVREDNPNWQGGKTEFNHEIRELGLYKDWRDACFIRDDYTCQKCNKVGGDLHVHHKTSFKELIKNIEDHKQARNCPELWNIDNGITLCVDCHKLEHITRGKI